MREAIESMAPQDARRTLVAGLAAEIDALVARARGDDESAIALLTRVAATSRDTAIAPLGPPTAIPLSELLGELLLKAGRPAEAVTAYERALTDRPNRSSALLGLARAKARTGDPTGASAAYAQLLTNWKRADRDVAALSEVRAAVRATVKK